MIGIRDNRFRLCVALLACGLTGLTACATGSGSGLDPDAGVSAPVVTGDLTGHVTDAETGGAVAGVAITTEPATTTAVTSSSGDFALRGIAAGTYRVVAAKDGYSINTVSDVVVTGLDPVSINLSLYRGDGVVAGTVVNTRGMALSGVLVAVVNESDGAPLATETTGESGAFDLQALPPGDYAVTFSPSSEKYCVNEKLHLAVTATHTLAVTLSGRPPQDAAYTGSESCASCHEAEAEYYSATPHAAVLKNPDEISVGAREGFISGTELDFDDTVTGGETPLSVALSQAEDGSPQMIFGDGEPYTIVKAYGGQVWKENYLTELSGQTYVLPVAWSVADGAFVIDQDEITKWLAADGAFAPPAPEQSYERRCLGCHVTGNVVSVSGDKLISASGRDDGAIAVETSVGCERCHGPGSRHAEIAAAAAAGDSLEIVQPRYLSVKGSAQVCGQCHSRGHSTRLEAATLAYPVDETGAPYRPGEDLDGYFVADGATWGDTGYSRQSHQEYGDFLLSRHYNSRIYNPRCSDCHASHGTPENYPHLLKQPADDNTLCLSCHTALNFPDEDSIRLHTQHPYDPAGTGASRCVGCHMTKTGRLAVFADVGGHAFAPVSPEVTLEMLDGLTEAGETAVTEESLIPNPCMRCHNNVLENAGDNGISTNALGGDPTSRTYLALMSSAFEYKFGESHGTGEYLSFTHVVIDGWMDKDSENHHGRYYLDNPETCSNACHGTDLKGGQLSDGAAVPSCFGCHYPYPHAKRIELDNAGAGDFEQWRYVHRAYFDSATCRLCHGEDYAGGISGVSCYQCHLTPGTDFTQFQPNCADQACHGTPPATGAHDVHYNGVFIADAASPAYGDTANYSAPEAYRFGCGTCHPVSEQKHRNGAVDVELYNEHADPGTMKGKMPSTAAFDKETRTCNNVYCHSDTEYVGKGGGKVKVPFPLQPDEVAAPGSIEDQIAIFNGKNYKTISSYFVWNNFAAPDDDKEAYYWSLPQLFELDALCGSGSTDPLCRGGVDDNGVAVYDYDPERFGYGINYPDYTAEKIRRYRTTPDWDGDENLTCGGCHGFPPRAYLSEGEWSAADPDWDNSEPKILMEAAIDKHSFVIPKLSADGTTIEVGHMANMSPFSNAPLRCQVCHVMTAGKVALDDWESGQGWSRENGLVRIDNLSIADRSYHANGQADIVFDTSGAVTSYRFNNQSYNYALKPHPRYGSDGTGLIVAEPRTSSLYYGIKGDDSPGASWNAGTKTCANVSCHLEQASQAWTAPYRPYSSAECFQCHQYYSDPTRGEDETMCWPHAEHNGCEAKEFDFDLTAISPVTEMHR